MSERESVGMGVHEWVWGVPVTPARVDNNNYANNNNNISITILITVEK